MFIDVVIFHPKPLLLEILERHIAHEGIEVFSTSSEPELWQTLSVCTPRVMCVPSDAPNQFMKSVDAVCEAMPVYPSIVSLGTAVPGQSHLIQHHFDFSMYQPKALPRTLRRLIQAQEAS